MHGNLARGLNARFGRFDTVWSGGGSCDTVAPSDQESLDDLAHTDCNPVTSGLVKWAHLWPGFTTYGWRFGETRTFKRPDWYYDPENPDNDETISLTRVRPAIFLELTDDELFDKLMARCMEIQRDKQAEYKAENRRFMGLKKLAKTKWWKRAKSWEDRFTLIPTVAASNKDKRIAQLKRDAGGGHRPRGRHRPERRRPRVLVRGPSVASFRPESAHLRSWAFVLGAIEARGQARTRFRLAGSARCCRRPPVRDPRDVSLLLRDPVRRQRP